MENYALIYNIADKKSEKEFQRELKKKFPINRSVIENDIQYFSFAEHEIQGVHDIFKEMMGTLALTDDDFVALYFTREAEPDNINRLMIFGTFQLIDDRLAKTSTTVNERVLADLLEYDFARTK